MRKPTPRDVSIQYAHRQNLQGCESPADKAKLDRMEAQDAIPHNIYGKAGSATALMMNLLGWDPALFDGEES